MVDLRFYQKAVSKLVSEKNIENVLLLYNIESFVEDKNLKLLVANNLFRDDLLHRINAIKIELPRLKKRSSDILELAEHFLEAYSKEYKVMTKILTPDVKKYFLKYEWPGNIRELQNVCKYLSIMSINQEITIDDLPKDLLDEYSLAINDKNWGDVLEAWILSEFNKNSINISKNIDSIYESVLIKSSLKLSNGNKTEASKILGWGRNTITNKIKNLK
jgi:two-component system nitrogen regulation response regulator GlnG